MTDSTTHFAASGEVDEHAERLAIANAKKYRSSGSRPMSIGEHQPLTASSPFYWLLHLSRLSIRIMIQSAKAAGRDVGAEGAVGYMDRQWMEGVRRFAARIAERRCKRDEPDEFVKLEQISASDQRARATFLRRYFPVPSPGYCGPESWTVDELKLIGHWMAAKVDPESKEWPHHPDGWQETLTMMKARK